MQFRTRVRKPVELDITPMVDVVFMLLLFFMVTTTFTSASGIKLDLPSSRTQDADQAAKKVVVTVDREGRYHIARQEVDKERLGDRLLQAANGDPATLIVIQADRQVRYEAVVALLDTARELRFSRLAIATLPVRNEGR